MENNLNSLFTKLYKKLSFIGMTNEFKFMIFIKSINSPVSISNTCRSHKLSGTEQCKNIYDKNVSTA